MISLNEFNKEANTSPQAFERSWGTAKRVWLCSVEPKAGRSNAWETHESTEPSMNCAKRIQHNTSPDSGSSSAARFSLFGPACLDVRHR